MLDLAFGKEKKPTCMGVYVFALERCYTEAILVGTLNKLS